MPPTIILGSDNPEIDVRAVQNAVDKPNIDVIVLRGPKPFNFGDGSSSQRKTVSIRRGVMILGEVFVPPGRDPVPCPIPEPFSPTTRPRAEPFKISTQIQGGGERGDSMWGKADSGPFHVSNRDGRPVIIAGISFSGWAGEAIYASACRNLEVINCEFTNPVPTTPDAFRDLGLSFVHAILAVGSACQGSFLAGNNVCSFGDYAPLPTDEQLLACIMSNFHSIRIVGNHIEGHDEGLEVILNGFNSNATFGPISIKNNIIGLSHLLRENENWEGHVGIVCCKNRNPVTEISHNNITVTGPGTAFSLSGEHFTVTDNELTLNVDELRGRPSDGVRIGTNSKPLGFPTDLGPSLNESVISDNKFSGVADFGMLTYEEPERPDLPPNDSHNNTIENNDLSSFQCTVAALLLTRRTHHNVSNGCFRTTMDMGWENHITSYCPAVLEPVWPFFVEALRNFREQTPKKKALPVTAERDAALPKR